MRMQVPESLYVRQRKEKRIVESAGPSPIDRLLVLTSTELTRSINQFEIGNLTVEDFLREVHRIRNNLIFLARRAAFENKTAAEEIAALEARTIQAENRADAEKVRADAAEEESRTDLLTGLPNRAAFYERLQSEIDRTRRRQTPFHPRVAVLDLGEFKSANDVAGHLTGDEILRLAGTVFPLSLFRATDYIARLGGDEFGIILSDPDSGDPEDFETILRERLNKNLAEAIEPLLQGMRDKNGAPLRIAVDIGFAVYNGEESKEELMHRADAEMFETKRQRKEKEGIAQRE
ncbi:MAG: GGDEF domain-containing protein [Patescibacteria group bacterium]|nr:GGDEF domain-containing protein [Patescibacteria group bacterium]